MEEGCPEAGGSQYDRTILEKAEEFGKLGQISRAQATGHWGEAQAKVLNLVTANLQAVVVDVEKRTLGYVLGNLECTGMAAEFLKERLQIRQGKMVSEPNGIPYDRGLLKKAEEFRKLGLVSRAQATEVCAEARARILNLVTRSLQAVIVDAERRTLEYVLRHVECTDATAEFVNNCLRMGPEKTIGAPAPGPVRPSPKPLARQVVSKQDHEAKVTELEVQLKKLEAQVLQQGERASAHRQEQQWSEARVKELEAQLEVKELEARVKELKAQLHQKGERSTARCQEQQQSEAGAVENGIFEAPAAVGSRLAEAFEEKEEYQAVAADPAKASHLNGPMGPARAGKAVTGESLWELIQATIDESAEKERQASPGTETLQGLAERARRIAAREAQPQCLEERLEEEASHEVVGGAKYDRRLLEIAKAFAKYGQVSHPQAVQLWHAAQGGKGVTEVEKQTLWYTLKTLRYTSKAAKFLGDRLASRMPTSGGA